MTATDRLAEIKARAEAATEGPWDYREEVLGMPSTTVMAGGEQVGYVAVGHFLAHDGTFIAHARTDVPALVAALEAVLAEHEPMAVAMTEACSACTGIEGLVAYPCPTVEAVNEALGGTK